MSHSRDTTSAPLFDAVDRPPRLIFTLTDEGDRFAVEFDGRLRYVPTVEILDALRHTFPPEEVPAEELQGLRWGPNIPRVFPSEVAPQTQAQMRQFLCRNLYGDGVEFGAGPRPLEVPIACRVRYADRFGAEEFAARSSAARGLSDEARYVDVDLQSGVEVMEGIANASVDFLLASHVIEHLSDPLGMLATAYDRLRPGGSLVLVVPDSTRTFDQVRPVTPFPHLLADWFLPSRDRDLEHYFDYHLNVLGVPVATTVATGHQAWVERDDLHLHTFTFESAENIARWACSELGYSRFWSHDGVLADEETVEFYILLTK